MSISEEKEILLSQLVDHELPADQADQVLAGILDELADVLDDSAMRSTTERLCSSCGRR